MTEEEKLNILSMNAWKMLSLIYSIAPDNQIDIFRDNYILWLEERHRNPEGRPWDAMCQIAGSYGYKMVKDLI